MFSPRRLAEDRVEEERLRPADVVAGERLRHAVAEGARARAERKLDERWRARVEEMAELVAAGEHPSLQVHEHSDEEIRR